MLPDLVYTRRGSGEPLVLFHGIGHRRQMWDPIFDALAERYDVIAPDLSGFGESPAFPKGFSYSMEHACEHLASQFAQWGIERPHVVGNSLGGAIALELGARGIASSVTALSPAGFFGHVGRIRAIGVLFVLRLGALLTPTFVFRRLAPTKLGKILVGTLLYTHPLRLDADRTFGDAMSLKRSRGFERTAWAGRDYRFDSLVPVPTTIAWAEKDLVLPFTQAATAKRQLPDARHVTLPACGHVPVSDDPELILRIIEQTIEEAREGRAA